MASVGVPVRDGYDTKTVAELLPILRSLDRETLLSLREHEVTGKARVTLLRRVDALLCSFSDDHLLGRERSHQKPIDEPEGAPSRDRHRGSDNTTHPSAASEPTPHRILAGWERLMSGTARWHRKRTRIERITIVGWTAVFAVLAVALMLDALTGSSSDASTFAPDVSPPTTLPYMQSSTRTFTPPPTYSAPLANLDLSYGYDPGDVGYDLDCYDIGAAVEVAPGDPNNLDADGDGIGCEAYG